MSNGNGGAPAGWYPDPDGSPRRRYWDGDRWTEYTDDTYRAADDPWAGVSSWPSAQPGRGGYGTPLPQQGLPDLGEFLRQSFIAAGRAMLALLPYLLVFGAMLAVLGIVAAGTSDIDEWLTDVVEITQETPFDEDPDLPDFPDVGGAEVGLYLAIGLLAIVGTIVLPVAFMRPAECAVRETETVLDGGGALARAVGRVLLVGLVAAIVFLVLLLAIVAFAAVTGGIGIILLIALVPLAFWLFVRWQLVPALIVLDGMTFDSFSRSFDLTRGQFWAIFIRVLVFGLIVGLATSIITTPLQLVAVVDAGTAFVLVAVVSLIAQLSSQMVTMAPVVVLRQRLLELEQAGVTS